MAGINPTQLCLVNDASNRWHNTVLFQTYVAYIKFSMVYTCYIPRGGWPRITIHHVHVTKLAFLHKLGT